MCFFLQTRTLCVCVVSQTYVVKALLSREGGGGEGGRGVRYLGLSRTHLKEPFEASRSGRWKSWHSTLWHHQNTNSLSTLSSSNGCVKRYFLNTQVYKWPLARSALCGLCSKPNMNESYIMNQERGARGRETAVHHFLPQTWSSGSKTQKEWKNLQLLLSSISEFVDWKDRNTLLWCPEPLIIFSFPLLTDLFSHLMFRLISVPI